MAENRHLRLPLGSNIAGQVDVEEVARWAGNIHDVVIARD